MKEKNEIYVIEKLGAFGEGIAKKDGKTVFIKGALPGEEVIASLSLVKKSFDIARLKTIVKASPHRVKPPCVYFGKCGGCGLQHLDYGEQLRLKQRTVKETMLKVAGMEIPLPEIVPSDKILGYRNKLSYPVLGRNVGLYMENSHNIVNIDNCLLQKEWNIALIAALKKFMPDYGFADKNEIRHIVAREKDGALSITLVTFSRVNISPFADYLPFSDFALYRNINPNSNNVIFGEEFDCIAAKGNAPDFHPASFYQVNDYIAEKLYDAVADQVKGGTIIDAYCGAGDLTLRLAKGAKRVIGVDICRQAVDEAREKARALHIGNADFYCGDCKKVLPSVISEGDDVTLFFDPPRKGLAPETIDFVKDFAPKQLVYVSCNPATLARDLKLLSHDYSISPLTLFDMFPNTSHVETLVLLSKKSEISHIDVRVEFGEGEGQISLKEAEKRAEERMPKEKVTYKMRT